MTESAPPRLYLLDAHGLIYQMFHAIPGMNAPDGRPTNAVFGVTRDLLYLTDSVEEAVQIVVDAHRGQDESALYGEGGSW